MSEVEFQKDKVTDRFIRQSGTNSCAKFIWNWEGFLSFNWSRFYRVESIEKTLEILCSLSCTFVQRKFLS